jgi:hypothetical protein
LRFNRRVFQHNRREAVIGRELDVNYPLVDDPRAAEKPWLPLQQLRLSEIPRELLQVECTRCSRCVEIQRLDAIKLYGPHAVWEDVGQRLLDDPVSFAPAVMKRTAVGRAGQDREFA